MSAFVYEKYAAKLINFFVTLEEFAGFLCIRQFGRLRFFRVTDKIRDRSQFYVLLQIAFNELRH